MRKLFLLLITVIILFSALAGCSHTASDKEITEESTSATRQENVSSDVGKNEPYEVMVPFGDYISRFTFDEDGKILSQTNPGTDSEAKLITYDYDGNGNCTSISMYNKDDAVFAEKEFTYDSSGNCTKETAYEYVDGVRLFDFGYTYERDNNGRIVKIINDKGTTEVYSYDENGLCISEDTFASDGSVVSQAKFSYDAYGNLIRTDSTKPKEDWTYEYDSHGRLIKETNEYYYIEYHYEEDGTVNIYTLSDLYDEKPGLSLEYYDNGKIIKQTWYDDDGEVDEVYIALVEELIANEPDPTALKNF